MYCGSCMHDNALAKGLRGLGVDCLLQPTYTPIRTDEVSIADSQIFFGGIQIYLLQRMPWLRIVPARLRHLLDWPPLIRLATRRAAATDAAMLGNLAVSMLRGTHGNQRDEVDRLIHWLEHDIRPDAVVLSNLLIGGLIPKLRERLPQTRVVVMLQGDDIFLDHLPEKQRADAISLCHDLQQHVDTFITNSSFYAQKMGTLLGIESERIVIVPLSIDVTPYDRPGETTPPSSEERFRIGYLARIAPEKGLHRLVEGFIDIASQTGNETVELHVAGWLGEANRSYFDSLKKRIEDAGMTNRFVYHGSPDLGDKVRFLRSLDVLCVPTEYEDPKGLYVLEALAAGVCVAQPDHGAFGELIAQTGGGLTFDPNSIAAMCECLQRLKDDSALRQRLATTGSDRVRTHHSIESAAARLKAILS